MTKGDCRYADIIIDIAAMQLNRTFQYRIPEALIGQVVPGSCVKVSFGNSAKGRKGYVLSLSNEPAIEEDRIKEIQELVTDSTTVESEMVKLAAWMCSTYGGPMSLALKAVFPVKQRIKARELKYLHLAGDESSWQERAEYFEKKHQVARLRLLKELIAEKEIPKEWVTGKLGVSQGAIKALIEMGLCTEDSRRIYRNPLEMASQVSGGHELLLGQRKAVDGILDAYRNGRREVSLIHGITGSGKTEVYIDIVEEIVRLGKQAIVLIPEIALTYQTVMRFYKRFGDRVSTMHSRLSQGERYDQFERAKRGEIDVVVGPRSALFVPFERLGVIIIDEEHEGSYKSELTPKYHAREVAIRRGEMSDAIVVLGSATPSVDSYYKAAKGSYKLYELKERATGGILPEVSIVDMRRELAKGNKSPFSEELAGKIRSRLEKKEQIMLFLNRRGYAGFVSCRQCGHVFKCPHCDVSLSGHRNGRLVCHYCGYEEIYKKQCPECGSKYVGVMKAGTEAIEKAVGMYFPEARVLRMDMDTTKGKDGHEQILSGFANGEADILIGTQMIVKGHDFPKVTLVGVLAADMSLYASDYRAGERTFQLLTQASGRAGRGEAKGEVVIQTYSPDNPYITAAAAQNYSEFYDYEISYRRLLSYPPAAHLLSVLFEDPIESCVKNSAEQMADSARKKAMEMFKERGTMASVIGPSPAGIAYINDIHRQVMYIKSVEYNALIEIKDELERMELTCRSMQFDFDPVNGY